ncbi:extracellular matrix protein 2-like [Rhinatrema bivittatum]|uniref:extracellular matrix protein 2-like n=1 Tax=Rhinatrema bivittatum TaxID=194408 RepID=UPI001126C77B|nr:extracellular matrix protein 2-like [Rhinatrema bivittatum]
MDLLLTVLALAAWSCTGWTRDTARNVSLRADRPWASTRVKAPRQTSEKQAYAGGPAPSWLKQGFPTGKGQCLVKGMAMYDGAAWAPDPCTVCICDRGKQICEPLGCEASSCLGDKLQTLPGTCCPVCPAAGPTHPKPNHTPESPSQSKSKELSQDKSREKGQGKQETRGGNQGKKVLPTSEEKKKKTTRKKQHSSTLKKGATTVKKEVAAGRKAEGDNIGMGKAEGDSVGKAEGDSMRKGRAEGNSMGKGRAEEDSMGKGKTERDSIGKGKTERDNMGKGREDGDSVGKAEGDSTGKRKAEADIMGGKRAEGDSLGKREGEEDSGGKGKIVGDRVLKAEVNNMGKAKEDSAEKEKTERDSLERGEEDSVRKREEEEEVSLVKGQEKAEGNSMEKGMVEGDSMGKGNTEGDSMSYRKGKGESTGEEKVKGEHAEKGKGMGQEDRIRKGKVEGVSIGKGKEKRKGEEQSVRKWKIERDSMRKKEDGDNVEKRREDGDNSRNERGEGDSLAKDKVERASMKKKSEGDREEKWKAERDSMGKGRAKGGSMGKGKAERSNVENGRVLRDSVIKGRASGDSVMKNISQGKRMGNRSAEGGNVGKGKVMHASREETISSWKATSEKEVMVERQEVAGTENEDTSKTMAVSPGDDMQKEVKEKPEMSVNKENTKDLRRRKQERKKHQRADGPSNDGDRDDVGEQDHGTLLTQGSVPSTGPEAHTPSLPAACILSESTIACTNTKMTQLPLLQDPGIKTLFLAENEISRLPADAFTRLPNLEWLDLSKNRLSDAGLPLHVFRNLTKLKRLNLDGNQLTVIPLLPPSLQELKMNDNNIQSLHQHSFRGLNKLLTLELEGNGFHDGNIYPLTFFNPLHSLIYLRLDRNNLRAIPSGLPTSLQELHLDSNHIEEVSEGVLNKTLNLSVLVLSNNRLQEDRIAPRAWINLPKLESLDLSYNRLVHVPSFLPRGLRQLTLHHNQIERIPGYVFAHLKPGLEFLHLSHNHLQDDGIHAVSFLGLYKSLSELLLDNNWLHMVPRGILKLRMLQVLRLSFNKIRHIPLNSICDTRVAEDSNLISLQLENNFIDRRLIPPTAFSCIKTYHSVVLRPQQNEHEEY